MFAAMSPQSLQRVLDLVAFAESADVAPGPIWENPEFRRRFADTSDSEFRVASAMLRDRLAKREHIDGLRTQMAECVSNVVRIQADMLGTARRVVEATTEWLASNPPALRSEQKGNPI